MRKHHNKLFYGKYTHKAVFRMPWAKFLYPTTDHNLNLIMRNPHGFTGKVFINRFSNINKYIPQVRSLAYYILRNRQNIKFRIQDDHVIIYALKNLIHETIDAFWEYWIDSFEVTKKFNMKLDKHSVVCNRLPHNKYSFQVWMKPNRYSSASRMAKSLGAYLLDKPDVGRPVNKYQEWWLKGQSDYDGSGYFYITDEKCLTPVHMILGENIDKIVKFVKI